MLNTRLNLIWNFLSLRRSNKNRQKVSTVETPFEEWRSPDFLSHPIQYISYHLPRNVRLRRLKELNNFRFAIANGDFNEGSDFLPRVPLWYPNAKNEKSENALSDMIRRHFPQEKAITTIDIKDYKRVRALIATNRKLVEFKKFIRSYEPKKKILVENQEEQVIDLHTKSLESQPVLTPDLVRAKLIGNLVRATSCPDLSNELDGSITTAYPSEAASSLGSTFALMDEGRESSSLFGCSSMLDSVNSEELDVATNVIAKDIVAEVLDKALSILEGERFSMIEAENGKERIAPKETDDKIWEAQEMVDSIKVETDQVSTVERQTLTVETLFHHATICQPLKNPDSKIATVQYFLDFVLPVSSPVAVEGFIRTFVAPSKEEKNIEPAVSTRLTAPVNHSEISSSERIEKALKLNIKPNQFLPQNGGHYLQVTGGKVANAKNETVPHFRR